MTSVCGCVCDMSLTPRTPVGAFGLNVLISNRWLGNLWGPGGLVSLAWGMLLLPLWTCWLGLRLGHSERYIQLAELELEPHAPRS